MDKAEQELLDRVVRELTKTGVLTRVIAAERPARHAPVHDTLIALTYLHHEEELRPVEIKLRVTAATLGAIRAQLQGWPKAPILITDHVTPPMADRLREAKVQFADAAGNTYIEGENFLVNIRGRPNPAHRRTHRETGRAFEPAGLRTLFVLLTEPEYVNRTYRQIAHAANVAHGTVGWTMADLAARGFLVEFNVEQTQRRRLANVEKLLPHWAEAYARALRPKYVLARYRVDDFDRWVADPQLQPGMLAGGEVAAAKMTGYLKPATATFWTDKVNTRFVMENRLILDPLGNVELMKKFWTHLNAETIVAPDLLTYADLLQIGDARTIETANIVRNAIHDRLVRQG
jgi:hypothetical protein